MAGISQPDFYKLGVVAKAHGTRGGLLIEVDDPDFSVNQLKIVYLQTSDKQWVPFRIKEVRSQFDRRRNLFFVILEGIHSRTQAESLRGQIIMSDHDFTPLDTRESKIGYRVIRADSSSLGIVSDILETPAYEVFVVQTTHKQVLIPHVDEYVQNICDESEKITVRNTAELESLE